MQRLLLLPPGFELLRQASLAEDLRLLQRLSDEWTDGTNRFALRGEALFGTFHAHMLVGVCGLSVDPYLGAPGVGRVRHLYVSPAHRRCGLGRALLETVVHHADPYFQRLRLRTDSHDAGQFYLSQGFRLTDEPNATHVREL